MKKNSIYILIILIALTACNKDYVNASDHETITCIKYTLLAPDSSIVEFKFEDYDGDGGIAARTSGSSLKPNILYSGRISLFVGDSLHQEDITSEIQSEGADHELFYSFTGTNAPTIVKTDVDVNSNPLGIFTSLNTSNIGTYPLTIILRHKPIKPNTGLQSAGGDTDVEVNFNVLVQ